jgi:hypothetical protein
VPEADVDVRTHCASTPSGVPPGKAPDSSGFCILLAVFIARIVMRPAPFPENIPTLASKYQIWRYNANPSTRV